MFYTIIGALIGLIGGSVITESMGRSRTDKFVQGLIILACTIFGGGIGFGYGASRLISGAPYPF